MKYETDFMADATSIERIISELEIQQRITMVVDVKDEELGKIGDLILHGHSPALSKLLREGRIAIFIDAKDATIAPGQAVYVIRLEPAYVVKDMKQQWK